MQRPVHGASMVSARNAPALEHKSSMVETKTNHAPINLEVLDAAVTRYLLEEELIESDAAPPPEDVEAEVCQGLHLFLAQYPCMPRH